MRKEIDDDGEMLSHSNQSRFTHLLRTDPVEAISSLSSSYIETDRSFSKQKYFLIAGAYEFALKAKADPKIMESFYRLPFFANHPKKPQPARILRQSMLFLVGGSSGSSRYDRGCNYAKALQESFDSEIAPHVVAQRLEEWGVEWLYRQAVAAAKSNNGQPENSNEETSESEEKAISKPAQPTRRSGERGATSASFPDKVKRTSQLAAPVDEIDRLRDVLRALANDDEAEFLHVRVTPELLEEILGLDVGTYATLRIRRRKCQDDFVHIVGKELIQ
ncbi:MAG: hypothetical protein JWM36_1159 [Hyphomicrobiales bacterium]|nr:hypothetical protein [Hyphomicrobiales bacterium]